MSLTCEIAAADNLVIDTVDEVQRTIENLEERLVVAEAYADKIVYLEKNVQALLDMMLTVSELLEKHGKRIERNRRAGGF